MVVFCIVCCVSWQVRDRETGDLLAMKVMDKAQVQKQGLTETVMAEKDLLERLRHPFVVNMHCSFQACPRQPAPWGSGVPGLDGLGPWVH